MPKTSSIIAELTIVCPISVLSFPNSFKTATEILTEVAVNIVPTNTHLKNSGEPNEWNPQKQHAKSHDDAKSNDDE